MKQTMRQRVINFLMAIGFKANPTKKRKYLCMVKDGRNYWIGKNGAVRSGKNPSNSISITNMTIAKMELWEKKQRKEES